MLRSLSISNYALIKELKIVFMPGLTTITGETGAGKSILLGALSLILGQRADTAALMDKGNKCIVEGIFDSDGEILNRLLRENDLDPGEQLILRREISPGGKSRAFVNDTPVNLQTMTEIGMRLVDIHSQHQNLELNNNEYQLNVIDAFAGLGGELVTYRNRYAEYRGLLKQYGELRESEERNKAEKDYLEYQFAELKDARLREGEQEELENEMEILQHAGEIQTGLFTVWQNLNGDDRSVINLLNESEMQLSRLREFHKPSNEFFERIKAAIIELSDLATEAEKEAGKVEHDQGRLGFVSDRLDLLYKLEQKHKAANLQELIQIREEIDRKLGELDSLGMRFGEMEKDLENRKSALKTMAEGLSGKRQSVIPAISERITALLVQLGIPNAVFKIQNTILPEPSGEGIDRVEFFFTANRKARLQEISRIASGGELSRLMLSIKYIISRSLGLPTIIFDEIDTGVSGEIAHRVSRIMKEMSADRQIFTITHLPQVASKGDQHYLVYKSDLEEGTVTLMKLLDISGRENEIAKMLSGEQTTEAALANAKELLNGR